VDSLPNRIHFHMSARVDKAYQPLLGDEVTFEIADEPKGPTAKQMRFVRHTDRRFDNATPITAAQQQSNQAKESPPKARRLIVTPPGDLTSTRNRFAYTLNTLSPEGKPGAEKVRITTSLPATLKVQGSAIVTTTGNRAMDLFSNDDGIMLVEVRTSSSRTSITFVLASTGESETRTLIFK
jgi:hypothetical protein